MSDENQLNSAEREFETALRSLRPTPAQIEPMAAALATRRGTGRSRLRIWQLSAVAAALVIGGGTWLAIVPSGQISNGIDHRGLMNERTDGAVIEMAVEPPTLLAYRRALARSTEELETLLDRQVASRSTPRNEVMRVGMLTLWSTDLHSLKGEM
jgi:hypothetical protein